MAEQREARKDCFAYSKENNRCTVLRKTYCKTDKCGFYKKRGTLCNGCPDKGTATKKYDACARCAEARKGM